MLTERQQVIYNFILDFRREHGCSPSIPEIQRRFNIRSPNGVVGHLSALEAKGFIRRGARGSRQIDVCGPHAAERGIIADLPLQGHIAAGYAQAADPGSAETYVSLDERTLGFRAREGCFVLRVRGDSMKDAGIFEGDMVVVEPTPEPRENQIVAALIDGENTLKRLVRVKGKWFLKAENPEYPELHPRSDLVIQGAVRTVIRRLP
ncbi:MAG TPA: transcriptional repressor LexA [Bryobacteraceae bacterium]|nr:transcriptional repressor LexA [Bryobacteraceae bacterium]